MFVALKEVAHVDSVLYERADICELHHSERVVERIANDTLSQYRVDGTSELLTSRCARPLIQMITGDSVLQLRGCSPGFSSSLRNPRHVRRRRHGQNINTRDCASCVEREYP